MYAKRKWYEKERSMSEIQHTIFSCYRFTWHVDYIYTIFFLLCIFSQSVRVFFSRSIFSFYLFEFHFHIYLLVRTECVSLFMVVQFTGFLSSSFPLSLSLFPLSLVLRIVEFFSLEQTSLAVLTLLFSSSRLVRLGDYVIVRP